MENAPSRQVEGDRLTAFCSRLLVLDQSIRSVIKHSLQATTCAGAKPMVHALTPTVPVSGQDRIDFHSDRKRMMSLRGRSKRQAHRAQGNYPERPSYDVAAPHNPGLIWNPDHGGVGARLVPECDRRTLSFDLRQIIDHRAGAGLRRRWRCHRRQVFADDL